MTAEFWDKRAQKYNAAIERHGAAYLQTVRRTQSLLTGADVVLDLGCATGEYSLDLSPGVRWVHGIDTSARMIAIATKKANDRRVDNVTFVTTNVLDRTLDAHGCTAVLAFSVLHLVEDIHAVLNRVHALLPAGGLLISETLCVAERGLLFRLLLRFAQTTNMAPPVLSLTVPELETVIARAGFDIVASEEGDPANAMRWIVARKT